MSDFKLFKHLMLGGALAFIIGAGPVWAEAAGQKTAGENQYSATLDKTVITARGVESTVSQTPGGVGIVKDEEIAIDQPISISDELARIPGVNVSSDSAWGSEVNIRGLGRGSLVFNIDGARVNTATEVGAQFGTINPNDIERVEVLKGPISALYGSGSIGGVVNVITRGGEFTAQPVRRSYLTGSYASNPEGFSTYANTSYNSPNFWIFGSASWRDFESYKAGGDDEIPNSQFKDYQGKLRTGIKWLKGESDVQVQFAEGKEIGIPGTGVAPMPTEADVTYPRTSRVLASWDHKISDISQHFKESAVKVYYQSIDRRVRIDNFPAASAVKKITPSADHETWGAKWHNVFACRDHKIVTGLDLWNWHLESSRTKYLANGLTVKDEPLPNADYFSGGVFAEDNWALGEAWTLNFGGRLDYISVQNDAAYLYTKPPNSKVANPLITPSQTKDDMSWNLHAGLTWNFMPAWSMSLLAASAYRAASMEERFAYIVLGSGTEKRGNPDLEPERSMFFEYGLHYNGKKFGASASAYANFLRDLITEKIVSASLIQYQNVSEALIWGGEAEAYWLLVPGARLYANLAYTRGEDTQNNADLPFIPPLSGLAGLRYDHRSGLWARVELSWALKQDQTPTGVEATDGWQTVGLRLGYKFNLQKTTQELILGVDNVFDEDYRDYLSTSRGIELKDPGLNFLATYRLWF
jgi:hemoglobin/transferrin/lactoferrin receptor protein